VRPAAGGQNFIISQSAFKSLKEEQREKGAKAALEDFAKENGFESAEDMKAAFTRRNERRSKGAGKPDVSTSTKKRKFDDDATDGGATDSDDSADKSKKVSRDMRRMERRLEDYETKNADLAKRMQREAIARKRAVQERDALEAEMDIRLAAVREGIKDEKFAMHLLSEKVKGLSEDEIAKFDEVEFFRGLRDSNPYLFGEVKKPATTGNGAGNAPGTPNPGAVNASAAQGSQVDARKMSREEYLKHLQSRGLNLGV